jgi:hypothetical protein
MTGVRLLVVAWLAGCALLAAPSAGAEPYLAVQQGYKCITCHVNPTGGGLRNSFGTVFTENVLPENALPSSFPVWSGDVFKFLRLGADLRTERSATEAPNLASARQSGLEQFRAYADVSLVPDRLEYYVDETLAPGNAAPNEYYGRYSDPAHGWYVKGGQFYLPFGWRLQDNTAFVREVSGISMTTPDRGFELGLELPEWSAQLDYSRGESNVSVGTGHELTGQAAWVRKEWRVGAAASYTKSVFGNRQVEGLFAGLRTGQVAWLGEIDLVRDAGYPGAARQLAAAFAEADWAWRKGHNVKVTAELFDPDRSVANDQQARWSVLYEYTPIPFVQLRAGFRRYRGIPQNDLDNRHLAFIELHLFL